ncbi:MAX gene-associated protein isoform X3 [Zootoca vivipara]|uniref:MAX gene-associated protein isoform X3 n=1 Tax=Zootoca vivipara TaxID=8524 RepID=UPI00293BD620|nr:MAX gene-associated protein isoform X3 [Zootoca vivipara]
MMKKQPIAFGNEDGGKALGTVPELYVLMKQPQITEIADQGDLFSNQEDNGLASSIAAPVKSKVKTCLPADCTSGSITVTLDNNNMWNEFYYRSTEMILTKQGRRMFPYCRYWITGLDSKLKYILVVDISPVDNLRYKWNGHSWEPSGKAEPHVLGRVFIHPESPSTGHYWMQQRVSFYNLKLTSNTLDQEGHIILHSMHRYLPRLHLVPADKATEVIQLNGHDVHTFIFPQTEFFAVTAYQNIQITQLKIDYNPFLKGFEKAGLSSRPEHKATQNDCPEQERRRVANFTSSFVSDLKQRDLDASCNAWKMCKSSLEKKTLTPDTECDASILKQDVSECPTTCESDSCVKSLLNSNDDIHISIKDEPVDDYACGPRVHTERILVQLEDTDKATEKYFCRESNKISEAQLEKNCDEIGRREVDIESHKQPQSVAKAKTLKLGSGTVPDASRKCCGTTKNMTISALRDVLSSYKTEKSSLNHSVNSLPVCFENKLFSPLKVVKTKQKEFHFRSNNTEKCYLGKDVPWNLNTETYSSHTATKKATSFNLLPPTSTKFIHGGKEKNVVKEAVLGRGVDKKAGDVLSGPVRRGRGRPRKVKFYEIKPSLKFTAKSALTSNVGPDFAKPELVLDYEDIDGVLFASFASKDVLDKHRLDKIGGREGLQNGEASFLTTYDSEILFCSMTDSQINLQLLETKLLEDLKSFRHRQVIHPSLQEVGLKLGSVDPTLSIDLKYVGVQLPLRPPKDYVFAENQVTDLSCQDTALSFISKTGKTNDFRKIKGWQGRLNNTSKQEGSILEDSLKNRSAFCSDKLDKYLETEGKLMESVGFSSSPFSYPMDCQIPSKSTSCVQALDKVPEKKPIITPPRKAKNKQTTFRGRVKSPQKFIMPLPVLSKQEHAFSALENISRSRSYSQVADDVHVAESDGNVQRKQRTVRQAKQRKQSSCPLHLSQMKLMELEDCALRDGKPQTCITEEWADLSLETLIISQQVPVELMELEGRALQNGKPRTCITKERADLSLASLLNPQASLNSKPIGSQDPAHSGICQLECVCAGLASGTCQPTLSCKTDCTFDCLKKRVALLKGVSVNKKSLKKYLCGIIECCNGKRDWKLEHVNKQMRSNDEFCSAEPDLAVMDFPLRVKEEGGVFIPGKSAIATKTAPDDADAGGELSGEPFLYPDIPSDVILADHSYVCRKPSKTVKVTARSEKQHARYLEGMSDEAEDGLQIDVPVCDALQKSPTRQEEAPHMKCSNGEQTHIAQMTDSEGPKQTQPTLLGKLSMSHTEKQQEKAKLLQSRQQNQHDFELLRRHWKERGDSMQIENDKETERGELEISCTRDQNYTPGKKCVDSAQEYLPNSSADAQENCNIFCYEKGLSGFRGENQAFKDDHAEPSRTWSRSSQNPVAKCLEKNASKTNYWKNGPMSFGITKDDIGNGEKTDYSAEEDIDGSSDHQIEALVKNTNWKGECSSVKLEENIPHLKMVEPKESEITIYNTKLRENKLPAHPSEFHSESIICESSATTSEMAKKNAEIVERLSSDAPIFHPDAVSLDHTYSITAMYKEGHHVTCPEEAPGDTSQWNGRDSSQGDKKMNTEPGEFSKKSIISQLKTTAAHALLPKQLHLAHDSSNKVMEKSPKPSGLWKSEPKNGTQSMTYRPRHTEDEQRRRKQMKELFEKLQGTLGLHSTPKIAKRILLEQGALRGEKRSSLFFLCIALECKNDLLVPFQATEDIQRLRDQADQLTSHKKFLLCKRNTLIRKVSALSGKPQEAILKKLEYIFTKQKALEEQENQNQQEMVEIIKTVRTASSTVENSPFSLSREMKPVILSNRHTKPLICSKNRSSDTENEDSLMMPRIVNVMSLATGENTKEIQIENVVSLATEENTKEIQIENVVSLATEENTNLLLDLNKKPYVTLDTDSQKCLPSMQIVLQETTGFQSEGNAEPSSRKQRDATGTAQVFLREKENCFPQRVNVSNMKGSPELFATKLFIEELSGNRVRLKDLYKGGEGQKSKDSSFQKLQINEPKDSGVEMELQKVASAIPEPALDASDLIDLKNDGIDETLTSLLNEIVSLKQQLNDAAPDRSKLPNSPSTELSLEGMGNCMESAAAAGFHFQFGKLGESYKDLCFVQESSGSVTPLLLQLEDNDLTDGDRNLRDPSSESGVFNLMPVSEVKDPNCNISTSSGRSWKNVPCMAKTTNVSLPVLQMKTNMESGHLDTQWKPMPKLAPFGLKGASFLLDSGRQNTGMTPLLAPVGANVSSVGLKATHSAVNDRSIK